MGFFGRLFGNEGEDTTVTDFQVATAAQAGAKPVALPPAVGDFRMVVEDVFSITGRGTVVTGKIGSGSISVGDHVAIADVYGVGISSTVTGVEMFRKQVTTAGAGENVGLLLEGVSRDDVARGAIITVTA